jgi:rubrerythrin
MSNQPHQPQEIPPLAQILREAMLAERTGHDFYRAAAERSQDPGAREAFAALGEEERAHYHALQERYRGLVEDGTTAWEPLSPSAADAANDAPLFSAQFRERIRERHFEMSALAIGVLLEKESIGFYRRQAESTEDPAARAFFEGLVSWETEHHDALVRQQNALREADWEESRFAPLL